MEDAGLLTRTRSKEDERVVFIKITDKGMELRCKAREIPKQMGGIICLSKEEADVMRKALHSILKEN